MHQILFRLGFPKGKGKEGRTVIKGRERGRKGIEKREGERGEGIILGSERNSRSST